MATRWYLQGTGNPLASPAFDSGWNSTGSAAVRPMRTAANIRGGTTNANDTQLNETSTTAGFNRLKRQHVSDEELRSATTVGGSGATLTVAIAGLESNVAADMYLQVRAYVVSNDGSTVRGSLYSGQTPTSASSTSTDPNYEFDTTLKTRVLTVPTNAVSAQAGDRIVVEIGYVACNTVATSYGVVFRINDMSASDLPATVDDASYATAKCWFELSDTLDLMPFVKVSRVHAEVLTAMQPALRVSRVHVEVLTSDTPSVVYLEGEWILSG